MFGNAGEGGRDHAKLVRFFAQQHAKLVFVSHLFSMMKNPLQFLFFFAKVLQHSV